MPKVPEYNLTKLKTIYTPRDVYEPASLKQCNLVLILCERHKIKLPDIGDMTKGQAALFISSILDVY